MKYVLQLNKKHLEVSQLALSVSIGISKGNLMQVLSIAFPTKMLRKSKSDLHDIQECCDLVQHVLVAQGGLNCSNDSDLTAPLIEIEDAFSKDLGESTGKTDLEFEANMSEEEAKLLCKSLDTFSRVGLGQIDNAVENIFFNLVFQSTSFEYQDRLRSLCDRLKFLLTGHPANGSYGIGSSAISDDFRIAFDIQQVLRHKMAWDKNPKGGIQVDYHDPMQWGKEPLPTVLSLEAK